MITTYQDTNIHFSIAGEGEAVVLLHGFLESSEIWEPFIPAFSQDRKIITLDLPGHGKSGCVADVHSMELMAEVVLHILEITGVKKANFIGHSMGGYVSLAFLEKHPHSVNRIMLLNSTPEADSESKKQIRERSVELAEKNKAAFISMSINNLMTPENSIVFATELKKLKATALTFSTEGITAALKGMKIRADRTAVLKDFPGDKIIVAGEEDTLINILDSKKIAQKCNCRFQSLRGGHLSYLESREKFKELCISSNK